MEDRHSARLTEDLVSRSCSSHPLQPVCKPFPTPHRLQSAAQLPRGSDCACCCLQRYVGGDDINVTVVSDDPAPGASLPPRSYTSLQALADEIGLSR